MPAVEFWGIARDYSSGGHANFRSRAEHRDKRTQVRVVRELKIVVEKQEVWRFHQIDKAISARGYSDVDRQPYIVHLESRIGCVAVNAIVTDDDSDFRVVPADALQQPIEAVRAFKRFDDGG